MAMLRLPKATSRGECNGYKLAVAWDLAQE